MIITEFKLFIPLSSWCKGQSLSISQRRKLNFGVYGCKLLRVLTQGRGGSHIRIQDESVSNFVTTLPTSRNPEQSYLRTGSTRNFGGHTQEAVRRSKCKDTRFSNGEAHATHQSPFWKMDCLLLSCCLVWRPVFCSTDTPVLCPAVQERQASLPLCCVPGKGWRRGGHTGETGARKGAPSI